MRFGWSIVRARHGWRWRVYEYGSAGRERYGWAPFKRWADAAVGRADRRLVRSLHT